MTQTYRWTLWGVLSVASCGGTTGAAPSTTTSENETAPPVVAEEISGSLPDYQPASGHPSIVAAVTGPHRAAKNQVRDRYRHPVATLEFFGLRPEMTVVEMWPGRGWYTEVLAPVVGESGKLICAITDPNSKGYGGTLGRDFLSWKEASPDLLGSVETVIFNPPHQTQLGEPNSVDMVVTFRSTHNWAMDGHAEAAYRAMYEVLRPGGVLGVVQHRERPGAEAITDRRRGYLPESWVVDLIKGVGFALEETSEVNANPRDTRDYPEHVWSLPPVLRQGDVDRERYLAIGESDRMTLRFRKPETAAAP